MWERLGFVRFGFLHKFLPLNYHALNVLCAVIFVCFYNNYFWEILSAQSLALRASICISFVLILWFAIEVLSARIYVKALQCALFIIAGLSAYFIDSLKVGIDEAIMEAVIKTDSREVADYLNFLFLAHFTLYVLVPCAIIALVPLKTPRFKVAMLQKLALLTILPLCAMCVYVAQGSSIIFAFKEQKLAIYVLNPIAPIRANIDILLARLESPKSYMPIAQDAKSHAKSKLFVLIIGESQRAKNYALNHYPRATNPYTSHIPNLINFSNFHSCGVITAIAVPCMLTIHTKDTYNHRDLSLYTDSLPSIAQRAGYKVLWISNNGGDCIGGVCRDLPREHIFYFNKDGQRDSDMLPLIKAQIEQFVESSKDNSADSAFIIIQLHGAHGPRYDLRYDKRFEMFKPTCADNNLSKCDRQSIINAYDNAIIASDYFVAEVINMLKQHQNAGLWLVSDHGESLGEGGNYMHGGLPYTLAPKEQTHIASMLWLNNGFKLEAGGGIAI